MKKKLDPKPTTEKKLELKVDEIEIDLEEVAPLIPPDGGWAWMVLLGSVMCMFFVDGLSFSYGVYLSDLQDGFDTSITKMSLGGSLIVGFTLISGPIVSAISNIFSFRTVTVTGGILSTLSIIACVFIYNENAFIVMFGVVTGFSFGLIYLPAATVVSQWFAKRRATATGISMCGSSIGATLYSLMVPKLVVLYTWRGALAVMAALNLHCALAGLMFIPLRDYQKLHPVKSVPLHEDEIDCACKDEERELELNGFGSRNCHKDFPNSRPFVEERGDRPGHHFMREHSPAIREEGEDEEEVLNKAKQLPAARSPRIRGISALESVTAFQSAEGLIFRSNTKLGEKPPPLVDLNTVNRVVGEVLSTKEAQHDTAAATASLQRLHIKARKRSVSARYRSPTPVGVEPSPDASLYVKHDRQRGDVLFASAVSLRPAVDHLGVPIDKGTKEEIVRQLQKEVDLPVHRVDLFYGGSMAHLNEFRSCSTMNEYMRTVTKTTEETAATGNNALQMLKELFDFGLFKSPTFILLISSSVFGLIGYPVPYVFLKDNAQTNGFSPESSSLLVTYMCAVNTVGRVLAGAISDWKCTDALFVNNAALIISGLACTLLPVLTSYAGHVCFAITYGSAIAAFVSLRVILVVEMLGLDRLTNAFGFLLLFQGLAFMSSPPLLAGFYDLMQSFDYTFVLAGASLIFSAIMCFPLRMILRWENRNTAKALPPSTGGCFTRLLRRFRDRVLVRRCSVTICEPVEA